jgi:hypothetical protein
MQLRHVVGWQNLLIALVVLTVSVPPTFGQADRSAPARSAAIGGLRLGIAFVTLPGTGEPAFDITLQNSGADDFIVNCGTMLANGKVMWPSAFHLELTDPSARKRTLVFADRRYPVVGGRVDDYIVSLRAGSSYVLRVKLADYYSPSTKEFDVPLIKGPYHVKAIFEGRGASAVSTDLAGMATMNFWQGRVESLPFSFDIPGTP